MLGNHLTKTEGENGIRAHILVTHYHWDHIQGIPFSILFSNRKIVSLYSFQSKYLGPNSLQQVFEAQLSSPYFPVDVSMMTAAREFHEVAAGQPGTSMERRLPLTH